MQPNCTCTRESSLYVHTFSVKGPRSRGTVANQHTSVLPLPIPLTHMVHASRRISEVYLTKYLVKYSQQSPFHNFRAFNDYKQIRILSRDRSLERSIGNWSHASRSIQVDCRYAAPICSPLRISLSFSFSSPSSPAPLFLRLSASFSRSHSPAFPTPVPTFPRRSALEFAKLTREIDHLA